MFSFQVFSSSLCMKSEMSTLEINHQCIQKETSYLFGLRIYKLKNLPDTGNAVSNQTIMQSQTIDEWINYSKSNPSLMGKMDKSSLEKKIRELCTNVETFSRLMNTNPTYINKASLEQIGYEFVKTVKDVPVFMAWFPNSTLIDRFVDSKSQSMSRSDMLIIIEHVPKSSKYQTFKRKLTDESKTLNECIEVARVCNECRDELAKKCIDQLETSSDHRRFLNYFGSTKYGDKVTIKYNEMISKRAENLGENINTEYPDFGPVISPDGTTMYFSRKNNPESYGGEDIYVSKLDNFGEWTSAVNVRTPLNNYEHNGVYSVSQDGKELFLHNNYDEGGHNPSITTWLNDSWSQPETQQIPNLKPRSNYHNGSLSIDGNYLLMSIKRSDSYGSRFLFWNSGGNDIYVILKDSLGNWMEPKNLGPIINTDDEEGSVFIAADGQTIYFSSAGHSGYGNQDMFMSRRLDSTWQNWTTPLNLGSTINSIGDDDFYVIPAKGDYIYFSSDRDGFGEEDIFRIGLPVELRPKPVAVIKGSVINKKDNSPISAKVVYEDVETGVQLGSVETNPLTGEYQIILVGGKRYAIIPIPINKVNDNTLLSVNKVPNSEKEDNAPTNTSNSALNNVNGSESNAKQTSSSQYSNNVNNNQTINNISISNTTNNITLNKNTVIAESQYIDLVNLKEYTEIKQSLVVVPIETGQSISLNNVFFQVGSFILKKESYLELNRIAKLMEGNQDLRIEIGGHTDDTGSEETNKILSEKRAYEVYLYLIKLSVPKERLIYVGYGEAKPKVPNSSDANRSINRRVELKIR